jgi:CBS domain containing-hemolysin-like protein
MHIAIPQALFFIFLALVSFFFSASETSLISLSKIRLRHMLAQGVKRAQHIQRLMANSEKFITAVLVGNNLVNIAMSAIATAAFVRVFGFNWGVVLATFATAAFVLIFCEITPKILAIKNSEGVALFTAPLMSAVIRLFNPLTTVFVGITNFILRVFRINSAKVSPLVTEEELRLLIEVSAEEGILSKNEKKMLHRIFEFGDMKVSDVMVPKEKISAAKLDVSPEGLLDLFLEQGHARLPVYKDSLDNVAGVIHAHDLLYILKEKGLFVLADLVREMPRIAPTMRVSELLQKFQAEKIQIALVTDAKGRTLGLVTLKDLVEEIVGEIEEGHPRRAPQS